MASAGSRQPPIGSWQEQQILEVVLVRGSIRAALAAAVMVGLAAPVGRLQAAAQDRSQDRAQTAPESAMPPAGMCRVWLRDVPERQQPAPTDCSTAIRTLPRDATVLFGDLKRAAKVSPNAAAALQQVQRNALTRDAPPYRGAGNVAGDARSAQQQRGNGASGVTGVTGVTGVSTAVPGGSAAATKAPEPKAAVKPEKPQ